MALAPWLDTSSVRSGRFRPMFKWWFALLAIDFVVLMWVGAMPTDGIYALHLLAGRYILVRLLPRDPPALGRDREAAADASNNRR